MTSRHAHLLGVERRVAGLPAGSEEEVDAVPIASIDRGGELLLSFTQERIWFLQQLNPESSMYNTAGVLRFAGTLNLDAIETSLSELVARHESLRTRFVSVDGRPVVRLIPAGPVPVSVADLRGLDAAERASRRERLLAGHRAEPFALDRDPLVRALVIVSADDCFEVSLSTHRIACDGWSLDILCEQLCEGYHAAASGAPNAAAAGAVDYLDFAAWQRARVRGSALDPQLAFWRQHLAGDLPALELPTDRPRPAQQTYTVARESRALPAGLAVAAAAAASDRRVPPYVVFLAAFDALLSRYTGEEDIVLGCPAPGRPSSAFDGVVGSFGTWLPIRVDLSGNPSFDDLLARAASAFENVAGHADVPFALLLETLQPRRDTSRSPVFQATLACEGAAAYGAAGGASSPVIQRAGTLVDVGLWIGSENGRLIASAEYSRDLFDRAAVARLLEHFETLLTAALEKPSTPLNSLPLLTPSEYHRAIAEWNATAAALPDAATLHAWFEAQAARTPEAVAVASHDGSLTYGELNARANQFARYLRRQGVAPESLVGVCAGRSANMLVVLLGTLKAGGAYVPLDPAYPADRLAYMLADAEVATIVGERHVIDALPLAGQSVVCLDVDWPKIAAEDDGNLEPAAGGDNLAYVIYTSGSTGRPKGVQVPHQAIVNFLHAIAPVARVAAGDTLGAITTLSFDIAGLELFLPLTQGATVFVISREDATDGVRLMEALAAAHVSALQATPATWRLLIKAGWTDPRMKMLCGGEALPRDLAEDLLAAGGELWNLYGPTETTIWSTVERVVAADRITIGRPIANTQAYVLDKQLNPVPSGVLGELYLAGHGVARGYRHRADLTAERFVPNPFGEPGSRMYRTGDVVRMMSDGRIDFVGRTDHQLKVRGFRVEPGEIEAALTAHPAVADAVVVASELDRGDRRLVAYLTCHPGDSLTSSELRRLVRSSLPEYMVPSFFVTLDRLPRTPNGKVDRRALPPPFNGSGVERHRLGPSTATERAIADIWQRVLHVPTVSAEDNFFDIGGHSLLSMRVVAEIARVLGHQVNPGSMFMENLKQIAAACDRGLSLPGAPARTAAAGSAAVGERYR